MRSQRVRWFIKVLVAVVLLGLILRSVDAKLFLGTIREMNVALFACAVLLFFPGRLLDALRWHFLLKRLAHPLPYWSIVRHNFLGQVSALVLPGQVSGDVVRVMSATHKRPEKITYVLSAVIDKLALMVALTAFVLCGVFASQPIARLSAVHIAALAMLVFVLVAFTVLCRYRSREVPSWLSALSTRFPGGSHLQGSVRSWLTLPPLAVSTMLVTLMLGFGVQFTYIVGGYFSALSMHIITRPVDWAAISAMSAFVQLLPLSIGGLGVREGVFAALLGLFGVSTAQATAFSLTNFAAVVVLTVVGWLVIATLYREPLPDETTGGDGTGHVDPIS